MRRAASVATLTALAFAAPAEAQAPTDPPCPAGVAPAATIVAHDLEDGDRSLTATHTITLTLEFPNEEQIEDEFTLVLPPGAKTIRGNADPAFRVDAAGSVPVTARWTHTVIGDGFALPHGSTCTASAEITLDLQPPRPLRFAVPRRSRLITELNWQLRVGAGADLRPVEVWLRGARRERLPLASAPVQTITLGLRQGDRPMRFGSGRVLRSAGWRFRFGPYYDRELPIRMSKFEKSGRLGFGFELELVQGGRRIGGARGVGHCVFSYGLRCRYRAIAGSTAAAPDPPCPPGVAPDATIRGFDVEDGGGALTATHTIALEARSPSDGPIRNVTFTLPPGARDRGSGSDPAFSRDSPGPVRVGATWSHYVEADDSSCSASTQGTLRLGPARPLKLIVPPSGLRLPNRLAWTLRGGEHADLRPVELRLRGARRARLPGSAAPVQKVALALRKGDDGLGLSRRQVLRTAGWSFNVGFAEEDAVLVSASGPERGRRREFGFELEFVQAGRRIGRTRAKGYCARLGCRYRTTK